MPGCVEGRARAGSQGRPKAISQTVVSSHRASSLLPQAYHYWWCWRPTSHTEALRSGTLPMWQDGPLPRRLPSKPRARVQKAEAASDLHLPRGPQARNRVGRWSPEPLSPKSSCLQEPGCGSGSSKPALNTFWGPRAQSRPGGSGVYPGCFGTDTKLGRHERGVPGRRGVPGGWAAAGWGQSDKPLSKPGKDSRGRQAQLAGSRPELGPGQTRQELEAWKRPWPEDRALTREGTGDQQGKMGAMGFPKGGRGGRHPRKPRFLDRDRLGKLNRWACTLWPRKPTSLAPHAESLLQLARPLIRVSVMGRAGDRCPQGRGGPHLTTSPRRAHDSLASA